MHEERHDETAPLEKLSYDLHVDVRDVAKKWHGMREISGTRRPRGALGLINRKRSAECRETARVSERESESDISVLRLRANEPTNKRASDAARWRANCRRCRVIDYLEKIIKRSRSRQTKKSHAVAGGQRDKQPRRPLRPS